MVDVAKVAGVSRGSIYSYYSERKRLLADVSEWAIGSFMEDLSKAMDSATTYPDKIGAAAVIMHRWTSVFHDPRFDDILHTPYEAVALIRESGPVLLRIMATLRPHVVAAARQGEIRADIDVERASEWVARLLQSLATSPAQTFDPGDPEALERLFSRFVLKGLA